MPPANQWDDSRLAEPESAHARSSEAGCLIVFAATAEDTGHFGEMLGGAVRPGDLILLRGPIGAGKTTFTQGLARGMGIDGRVTSPSFTLANVYDDRRDQVLYHLDLWRIRSAAEALGIGLEEYLNGEGVCVVEWPEIAEDVFPGDVLRIQLELAGEGRRLVFCPSGPRSSELVDRLRAVVGGANDSGDDVAARY